MCANTPLRLRRWYGGWWFASSHSCEWIPCLHLWQYTSRYLGRTLIYYAGTCRIPATFAFLPKHARMWQWAIYEPLHLAIRNQRIFGSEYPFHEKIFGYKNLGELRRYKRERAVEEGAFPNCWQWMSTGGNWYVMWSVVINWFGNLLPRRESSQIDFFRP